MLTGIVALYFALACALMGWLVFPEASRRWLARWRPRALGQAGRAAPRHAWGHPAVWALAVLALATPALVVAWLSGRGQSLEAFDDARAPGNALVGTLFQGEQLVPPPPLPPEVFTSAEVEVVRPMLSSADRRWEQMDPEFVQRLLMVFKIMKEEHGYDMALLEGWRSPERQARLAQMGSSVTNAGAWQSYHQYGLGADCAFLRDGKLVITEKDPWAARGYELYGEVAERMGLTWGGRWRMMDLGHVEWRKPGVKLGRH